MIYLPINNFDEYSCYFFKDSDTIVAVKNENEYTEFYINSHYLKNDITGLTTTTTNCIDKNLLTNDWKYRNDISDICVVVACFSIFFFAIPLFIVSRFIKKRSI